MALATIQSKTDTSISTTRKPPYTWGALAGAVMLVFLGAYAPWSFAQAIGAMNARFMAVAADGVVGVSSLLLMACVAIALSPLGRIRLGDSGSKPEFSTTAWLAMLFAAGMGSGLLYWGVAEPIIHIANPPPYSADMKALGDARMAMAISYLHWTLHPWGIYAAGALCIAYFSFCHGYPMLPSSPFRAIMPGHPFVQALGNGINLLCLLSVLLGLAAAVAVGAMQISSGIQWIGGGQWLGGWQSGGNIFLYVVVVAALSAVYLLSATSGLQRGIKRLSVFNVVLAVVLAAWILFLGAFDHVGRVLVQSVADYVYFLPELSARPLTSAAQPDWAGIWTANYFLSWMAWVPFVSIFIARISKGRTIRAFMLGVIGAPSLFTFIWFAILGGTALEMQQTGAIELSAIVRADSAAGLFALLGVFPAAQYLWILVVALVFTFLVTSADSATYVLAMFAGQGKENPGNAQKLFWGLSIAALALIILFSQESIHSVRAVFSFAGIAILFVLVAQMGFLIAGLTRHYYSPRKYPAMLK